MRRCLLPTAVFLAALTALALLGAAMAVRPPELPPEADGPQEVANRQTALRFYAAANTAIATGDLAPLTALVAPALLADGAGADPVEAGLARRLLALHATAPGLRLTVTDLAVDGDLVLARVEAGGGASANFLGLRFPSSPRLWGPVNMLRLAEGRIVAHDGGNTDAILLEPTVALPWWLPAGDAYGLTVRQLTLATGATYRAAGVDGLRQLLVVVGAVTVEVAEFASAPAFAVSRQAGERLGIPAGGGYSAVNAGEPEAVLLELTVALTGDEAPAAPRWPAAARVTESVLARGEAIDVLAGPVVLAVGWATLAPGTRLAWEAAGPVLLHVTSGAEGAMLVDPSLPLESGSGVFLPAGAAALQARSAPATVLVVTLIPAAESTASLLPTEPEAAENAVGTPVARTATEERALVQKRVIYDRLSEGPIGSYTEYVQHPIELIPIAVVDLMEGASGPSPGSHSRPAGPADPQPPRYVSSVRTPTPLAPFGV